MANTTQLTNVRHIQAGERVTAGVTGRPDRTNDRNIRKLAELFDAANLGRGLLLNDVTVAPDVQAGEAVFWNATTARFERALAAVEVDAESDVLVPKASADTVGLVVSKTNATLATIGILGLFAIPDLANGIAGGEAVVAGRYYLSAAEAGKIVKQRPPVSVTVGYIFDATTILVLPSLRDFLEDHIHYRFDLTARPAGTVTPPLLGERHVIAVADDALPGWLPADHDSFDGHAPAGAAFGYNLAAHTELSRVFPPVPLAAAVVTWDKGVDLVGATEVPMGSSGLVVVDAYGIWWMSDCYGDVPWPTALDTAAESSSISGSVSSSSVSAQPECPRDEVMRITLAYSRAVFATDKSVVTKLEPDTDSPITIKNCDGDDANTGALKLGLNLNLLIDDDNALGGQVLKSVLEGFQFTQGWVAEGLIADNDQVILTSTHSRLSDPDDEDSDVVHQGIVRVSVNVDPTGREISPEVVRVSDAETVFYQDLPSLGFLEDRAASIRLRLDLPPVGMPNTPKLAIRVWLFGRETGTLPAFTLSYRRVTRPDGIVTPTPLPTADTAGVINTAVAVVADEVIEIDSDEFTVAAGDSVFVTLSRAAGDGYAGDVLVMRIRGVILSG